MAKSMSFSSVTQTSADKKAKTWHSCIKSNNWPEFHKIACDLSRWLTLTGKEISSHNCLCNVILSAAARVLHDRCKTAMVTHVQGCQSSQEKEVETKTNSSNKGALVEPTAVALRQIDSSFALWWCVRIFFVAMHNFRAQFCAHLWKALKIYPRVRRFCHALFYCIAFCFSIYFQGSFIACSTLVCLFLKTMTTLDQLQSILAGRPLHLGLTEHGAFIPILTEVVLSDLL